jgi:hypothetical protein
MTLVLELTSEEEARLEAASRLHGVDPTTYAKQLVTDHLPAAKPTVEDFEQYISKIARPLPTIPSEKQTREHIYED